MSWISSSRRLTSGFDTKISVQYKKAITTGRPHTKEGISGQNLYLRSKEDIRKCIKTEDYKKLLRMVSEALEDENLSFFPIFEELWNLLETGFTKEQVARIVSWYESFSSRFIVPIEQLGKSNDYLLDETRGPTDAFKDLALQMLTEMVAIIVEEENTSEIERAKGLKIDFDNQEKEGDILEYYASKNIPRPKLKFIVTQTSTSGDTGPAGQDGILGKKFIVNIVGYPQAEATTAQRWQMQGRSKENVLALPFHEQFSQIQEHMNDAKPADMKDQLQKAIEWKFQDLILKYGFEIVIDSGSFNSINPARIDGQMNYHAFWLYQAEAKWLLDNNHEIIEVVSSGNGGHVFSILMAREMTGISGPTIITTNENDMFYKIIEEGKFQKPQADSAKHNPSVSMIIDFPNNMWRLFSYAFWSERANEIAQIFMSGSEVILNRYEREILKDRLKLHCVRSNTEEELDTIYQVLHTSKRLICPHTANAYHWLSIMRWLEWFQDYNDTKALISETASPWKFLAAIAAWVENQSDLDGTSRSELYTQYREFEKSVEGCRELLIKIQKGLQEAWVEYIEEMIPEWLRKIYLDWFYEPESQSVETFHPATIAFVNHYAPELRKQVDTLLHS